MKNFGFLIFDKEPGWTSFDVCAKLRRALRDLEMGAAKEGILNKKPKIAVGHTGTLDPFATGMLLCAFGKATRLIPFLEKDRKTYETVIVLGKTTATLDNTSEIEDVFNGKEPSKLEIEKLLQDQFTGKIRQIPPAFSAIKIEGKRAYDLARAGKEFEIASRETEIFSVEILDYEFPRLTLRLEVAAGFYVRSFARDLGTMLSGAGYCESLRRTKIGNLSLSDLEFGISNFNTSEGLIFLDPREILPQIPVLEISSSRIPDFVQGRAFGISETLKENDLFFIESESELLGIGQYVCEKIQPKIVLKEI